MTEFTVKDVTVFRVATFLNEVLQGDSIDVLRENQKSTFY